tara:strand:+ start:137544 stop:138476 length:933 start_codon:yes stop_codon:yes gene_type:complete
LSFDALDAPQEDARPDVARCFSEPGGASSITLDAFGLEFPTPNTLRLEWETSDPAGAFESYEILLIEAEQQNCDVQRFDATTNPGLAYFQGPVTDYKIRAASIGPLDSDTDYVAQLLAHDRNGGLTASALLTVRTSLDATEEVTLFSEQDTAGYSIPSEMSYESGQAFAGSQYYEYTSLCVDSCFENLRRQDIGVSLADMSEAEFATAYYEFALASSGTEHSIWSQGRLSFVQSDGSQELFVYAPFALRADGEYAVYQIPLRAFGQEGLTVPLTYEVAKRSVYEFTVGGLWPLGATVRLDELRIRWQRDL